MARIGRSLRPDQGIFAVVLLLGNALLFGGLLFQQSSSLPRISECGDWSLATESTAYLAPDDLYRICGDWAQALTSEEAHQIAVAFPAREAPGHITISECGEWQLATETTERLAPDDIYRRCGNKVQVLVLKDDGHEIVSYPVGD